MKDLTHDQEMKLSELLFKALDLGCWHEPTVCYDNTVESLRTYRCKNESCKYHDYTKYDNGVMDTALTNPSLFTRSAFLDVFDAVKDRGTLKEFLEGDYIHIDGIASPHFQLEVLKWLLEKDGRLGELEEIMEGVGDV